MELKKMCVVTVIYVAIVIATFGCSSRSVDSFLLGEECNPPCWKSITPGITTQPDAINAIDKLVEKENYSVTESDIYLNYRDNHIHIRSDKINHVVDLIDFGLKENSLGQVVDLFGPPEYLSFQMDSGGCTILTYYPDRGTHFMGQCNSSFVRKYWIVSRNTKITRALFTKSNLEMEELLVLFFGDQSTKMMDTIIPWDGYKNYPPVP